MLPNNYSGKFIVFEGLDGSGQTTQVELLKEFLEKKQYSVVATKEPTQDSKAGLKIKKILTEKIKIDPFELQKLFAEDRACHLREIIIPNLKDGKIVISDRYFFSSFAFGSADGADLEKIIELNNQFLLPDICFLLKVSPKECIKRIEKRGEPKTLFEEERKLAKVWHFYEIISKRFKCIKIIDGEKPIDDVFNDIKKIILRELL